ncbi:hypothetical protein [Citrobacter freundii]|uniref:hypothetical protein n=1 Tax=Citrobacter freundii TaxID=546 RepID=UPI001F2E7AA9|nr:hypothetical protein [Citrobacter freundii]
MTTNNHPAHGHVSVDRLHQIREILSKASAQSDGGNLGYAMADAVKVIDGAIAAFGAEPVADVVAWNREGEERTCDIRLRRFDLAPGPLFAVAQPATVVPDEKPMPEASKMYAIDAVAAIAEVRGWNACRAAMLQAGNSPATPDGWQLVPKKITLEMECAISRADSYEIGWQWALAAAPKYEVKS